MPETSFAGDRQPSPVADIPRTEPAAKVAAITAPAETPMPNGTGHEPIQDKRSISPVPSTPTEPVPVPGDAQSGEVDALDNTPNPKSPSTSSLSSLSSSSPEPSHDLLLPQTIGNGSARDLSEGDSEAETDRLEAGELREEIERSRRILPLQRIEEGPASPHAGSEDQGTGNDHLTSPTRKRRHSGESDPAKRIKVDSIHDEDKAEGLGESGSDGPDTDGSKEERKSVSMGSEEVMQAQRKEAISYLTEIEVEFAKLRDRIHADKMARFVAEIEMCAEGTHPELEYVYGQIQSLHEAKVRRAEQRRKYQRICIDMQTRAGRDQVHQQFLKDQADTRAALLLKTTEEWYRVNRERRVMDALVPEYGYRPAESLTVQQQQRTARAREVAALTAVSRHIGFPAAPAMQSSTADEIEEDLQLLGAARSQAQAQHLQHYHQHHQHQKFPPY